MNKKNENNKNIINEKTGLKGTVDVIGMDVFAFPKKEEVKGKSEEELKELIKENTYNMYKVIKINEEIFLIKITMGSLNNTTSIIPEDLPPQDSIQIQMKIAEMLKSIGIDLVRRQEAQERGDKISLDDESAEKIIKEEIEKEKKEEKKEVKEN